jgi:hypothetical protein
MQHKHSVIARLRLCAREHWQSRGSHLYTARAATDAGASPAADPVAVDGAATGIKLIAAARASRIASEFAPHVPEHGSVPCPGCCTPYAVRIIVPPTATPPMTPIEEKTGTARHDRYAGTPNMAHGTVTAPIAPPVYQGAALSFGGAISV